MKFQVLYDSKHGHSKKVALAISNLAQQVSKQTKICADIVVFVCPTYGDEELPHNMEDFLQALEVKDKKYVICELGNYYGFENFEFGAAKIIEWELNRRGWKKFFPSFSLDSLPEIDWEPWEKWKKELQDVLSN